MTKLILTPWRNRNIVTEVTCQNEVSEEEARKISEGIFFASMSCCVPGWKKRTLAQIKEVISDRYGEKLADCIVDVRYS